MTTTQSRATNTPEKPPDYLSVTHNSFFADASNRTFLSSGDSALATALRGDATSSGNASQPTKSAQGALSNFGQLQLQLADSAAGKFLTSVEWSEFAKSTGEWVMDTAFGLLKDKSAEYIAIKLGTEAALPLYAVVSFTHDLLSPVETNGGQREELTYFDRLSPADGTPVSHPLKKEPLRQIGSLRRSLDIRTTNAFHLGNCFANTGLYRIWPSSTETDYIVIFFQDVSK